MSALSGCTPAVTQKSDQEKYCESWSPRPNYCGDIALPEGWSNIATAPAMEWIDLLLITKETKVGFRSREDAFLLKDTYERVYPLAWRKITPQL